MMMFCQVGGKRRPQKAGKFLAFGNTGSIEAIALLELNWDCTTPLKDIKTKNFRP